MMKHMFQRPRTSRSQSGFMLLDMVVSMGIFLVVLTIIIGALLSITDASRKARSLRTTMDNLNAALESISRTTRMGTSLHCGCGALVDPTDTNFPGGPRNCRITSDTGAGGAECFALEGPGGDLNTTNDQIVYRLNNSRIQRSTDGGSTYIDLTAPEVVVESLKFYVNGSVRDEDQPNVTILMKVSAGITPETKTTFNVQTTVGQRTPNITLAP